MMEKRYLGDGVYAEMEDGRVKLTAENGLRATDTVYLEPAVYVALTYFVRDVALAEPQTPEPTT
jgi:hypothetical protein